MKTYASAGKCEVCGVERWKRHRHHKLPKSLGGSDEPANIAMLCGNCHEDAHRPGTEHGTDRLQQSPETRRRRSVASRRAWDRPETRERHAAGLKRIPREVVERRLAAAAAARRASPPEVEAVRAAKSAETRARLTWEHNRERNLRIVAFVGDGGSIAGAAREVGCPDNQARTAIATARRFPDLVESP